MGLGELIKTLIANINSNYFLSGIVILLFGIQLIKSGKYLQEKGVIHRKMPKRYMKDFGPWQRFDGPGVRQQGGVYSNMGWILTLVGIILIILSHAQIRNFIGF